MLEVFSSNDFIQECISFFLIENHRKRLCILYLDEVDRNRIFMGNKDQGTKLIIIRSLQTVNVTYLSCSRTGLFKVIRMVLRQRPRSDGSSPFLLHLPIVQGLRPKYVNGLLRCDPISHVAFETDAFLYAGGLFLLLSGIRSEQIWKETIKKTRGNLAVTLPLSCSALSCFASPFFLLGDPVLSLLCLVSANFINGLTRTCLLTGAVSPSESFPPFSFTSGLTGETLRSI